MAELLLDKLMRARGKAAAAAATHSAKVAFVAIDIETFDRVCGMLETKKQEASDSGMGKKTITKKTATKKTATKKTASKK